MLPSRERHVLRALARLREGPGAGGGGAQGVSPGFFLRVQGTPSGLGEGDVWFSLRSFV